MSLSFALPRLARAGMELGSRTGADDALHEIDRLLRRPGLATQLELSHGERPGSVTLRLSPSCADWLAPDGDTLGLAQRVGLDGVRRARDLELEIVLAMLLAPAPLRFATAAELASALRVRAEIVHAARETRLDFETKTAERPAEFVYDEERGFLLRPGCSLIEALELATQPRLAGRRYSFSCWRATEYVLLLAVTREARAQHPELAARLARQAERRALKGAAFDRVFLEPHGSTTAPLPTRYYVPGDRTWFRNPDPVSSAVAGFEGSYTFYLGAGGFADFWRDDRVESFAGKCLTLFYWRMAVVRDAAGEPRVDEGRVGALVERALANPPEARRVLTLMERVQDAPQRFFGGCIDPTRDHVRTLTPGACEVHLPDGDERVAPRPSAPVVVTPR